jgi:hypothetical protein
MIIIGVDFHPEFQQIASVDTDTGKIQEKRLAHGSDRVPDLNIDYERARVGRASTRAKWRSAMSPC